MNEPAIQASGLRMTYPRPEGGTLTVLDGVDLAVPAGEFLCLLGPTGCGKTTLLRLLAGLETPIEGDIARNGSGRVGVVFQQNSLLPWRRIGRNVAFPLELAGMPRRVARERAMELLSLVRLEGVEKAYPYELSGGMQQRAAIARALATGSDILLMDEPFGSLDERTRILLQDVLRGIHETRGTTVVFVTHNIEEALVLGDRVIVLGGSRIMADETVGLERPRDRLSDDFVEALVTLRRTFAEAVGRHDD